MKLTTKLMTRSDCYTAGRKIKPKGIMVHSTATPGIMAADWFSRWNKSYKAGEINRQVCVHAFLDDKEVWQYLPWDHRGWHGSGSSNNTHIGFEICEPGGFKYGSGSTMIGYDVAKNQAYFDAIYKNAIELCVILCKQFGLTEKDIICHSEGYKLGIASNHGDVMHWFPKHGKNMDMFRADVKKVLTGSTPTQPAIGKPIIGKATAMVDQGKTWAKNNGATDLFISLADTFWKLATAVGINPVLAYAQSAKETGYGKFKGVLNENYMNPCGMKTKSGGGDSDPNAHQRFTSWEQGIQAQIDHLALYAGAAGYPKTGTSDPRHFPYLKGTATTAEQLGGKWAPAASYGTDIVAMMAKLEATKAVVVTPTTPDTSTLHYVQTGAYSVKTNADAQYNRVKAAGFDALIKQAGGLYRVQVGAYSIKANADAMAAKLKAKGFDTYITTTAGTIVQPGSAPAPTKKIAAGSKVKVNATATKYSTGQTIPAWVKANTYTVQQISGEKALLKEITSWVNLKDLTAV